MKFHAFEKLDIKEDFFITNSVNSLTLISGSSEFVGSKMMKPLDIPWVGATIAPCSADPSLPYIEHPSDAFSYYKERGIKELSCEIKMMGSRAIIVFDQISKSLFIYSRGLRKIELDHNEYSYLYIDCVNFCKFNNINGFVADTEMLPWSRLGEVLINNEFIIPAVAYVEHTNDIEYFSKYKKVLSNYTKKVPLAFHVFDIITYKDVSGLWVKNNMRDKNWIFSTLRILKDLKYKKIINLDSYKDTSEVSFLWSIYTDYELYEGMVFKPIDLQLDLGSNLVLPYMKIRGREYLRIIYGIKYEDYIGKLKNRNTKWKRMQSIGEYILNRYILDTWIKINNNCTVDGTCINYIFAYMGLRKSKKAVAIDATL